MPRNAVLADDLLAPEQAARLMERAPQTLANMRARKQGPAYIKLGPWRQAPVRYRRSDVERWVREQIREVAA